MYLNKKILTVAVVSAMHSFAMAASGGDGVATPVCGYEGTNIACGGNAQAVGGMATAIGRGADAAGAGTAYGFWSMAAGSATAVGGNAMAAGVASIAIGAETIATGMSSIMVGNWGAARGQDSIALGTFATTNGTGSVAIGAGSTDGARSNVVSVGDVGAERQIVNVAAGTATTDAVNLGQLNAVETIARNADSKATTALTTANSADSKATTALTTANSADSKATTALTTANSASSQVAELSSKVVTYSDAATVTLRDNNGSGTVVRNVADGTAANDAANYGQLRGAEIRIMAAVHTLIETGACSYSGGKLQCGGATATGQSSVASGTNALSSGLASVASGTNARATGTNSVALGAGSVATGTNSVALGAGSVATGTNSVALGAGSVASRDNTVSIGNPGAGAARILTGVGRGVLPNDAVNVEQFRQGLSQTLSSATRYAAQATASALAIPQAHIQSGHSNAIAVSVGHYDGYGAIGVSYSHRVDNNASVQLGVGSGGSNIAGRAGFNVSW